MHNSDVLGYRDALRRELLGLTIKTAVLVKDGVSYALVDGKTGQRRIPLTFSIPYIANYVNEMRRNAKPGDAFFVVLDHRRPVDRALDYHHVQKLLNKLARDAKLEKHIYAHLFRHSRATFYASKLTEQEAKRLFGWSGDSKMMARYVHLSGKDIDNAVLRTNGLADKDGKEIKHTPQIKKCEKCNTICEVTAVCCTNCGSRLDQSVFEQLDNSQKLQERVEKLETALIKLSAHIDSKTKKI